MFEAKSDMFGQVKLPYHMKDEWLSLNPQGIKPSIADIQDDVLMSLKEYTETCGKYSIALADIERYISIQMNIT